MSKQYKVDGRQITDLPSLCREFAAAVQAPNGYFGHDLASFDDCLFGGYGLETPCEVVWTDSEVSKRALSCEMLAAWCSDQLDQRTYLDDEGRRWLLETKARAQQGQRSMFDEVIHAITSMKERSGGSELRLVLA